MLLARNSVLPTHRAQSSTPILSRGVAQSARVQAFGASPPQVPPPIVPRSPAPARSPAPRPAPVVAAGAAPSPSPSSPAPNATASEGGSCGAMEVATLGGGCFWCIEACYNMMRGVQSAVSGYAAGHVKDPTYKQVCSGTTGHAEVVQVTYDPALLSYRELLQIFFTLHDPTTKDRQGSDVGPQYRSIILTHSEQQRAVAEEVMKEVASEGWWPGPLVTEVQPLDVFYPAEDYHQEYFVQNPGQGYCRAVVGPKVAKFRSKFAAKLK